MTISTLEADLGEITFSITVNPGERVLLWSLSFVGDEIVYTPGMAPGGINITVIIGLNKMFRKQMRGEDDNSWQQQWIRARQVNEGQNLSVVTNLLGINDEIVSAQLHLDYQIVVSH